jgi:mannonate dehydratase
VLQLAELLEPSPQSWWRLLRQVGITRVVSLLEDGEQRRRWLGATASQRAWALVDQTAPRHGERCWDEARLAALRDTYAQAGFELVALEDTPPMDLVRLGRPGRDEQIEWFQEMLIAMGRVGIPVVCYNWLAVGSWARTDVAVPARAGALLTGYDHAVMQSAPPLIEPGSVTHDDLWDNLAYFLDAVVPVAQAAGVRIAMHPDDPPLTEVRGVPRIMNSLVAFDRLLETAPGEASGITFCQGNFRLMTADLPAAIRHFGSRIQFVHFRDVAGTAERFVETFHDDGPTDLFACMRAYAEVGFGGPMRADHVPTLDGESNDRPGYAVLGRLHAAGYVQGLRDAAYGKPSG